MNSILYAVQNSTEGILSDTKALSYSNLVTLLWLLVMSSICLIVSIFIIMPV